MKKLLLLSASAMAIMLASGVDAQAQNTAYGFYYSYSMGQNCVSYDISAVNTDAKTKISLDAEIPVFEQKEYEGISGGASVGDGYIAIFTDENYTKAIASYNMETGNFNILQTYARSMSDTPNPGSALASLAYDSKNQKVYALESQYSEAEMFAYIYELNQETFELTEYTAIPCEGDVYKSIAVDSDGNIYVVKMEKVAENSFYQGPNVYKLDANKQPTISVAKNKDAVTATNEINGMAFDAAGDLYYNNGPKTFKVDFANEEIKLIGETDKAVAGLTFTKSTKDFESTYVVPKDVRNLISVKSYGSHMGDAPDNVDTHETKYFYDINNKMICMIEYGRKYTDTPGVMGDYEVSYIHRYEFDEQGRVISHTPLQYGLYDYGDPAFKESQGKETFEYNEAGQLAKKVTSLYTYLYDYDEKGHLLKEVYTSTAKADTSKIVTYVYFDEESDQPTFAVCESLKYPESTYDNWASFYGYDENGKKIGAYTKELGKMDDLNNIAMGDFTYAEAWEYNETGDMMNYTKFKYTEEMEIDTISCTVGEYVDGNPDQIRHTSYSFWEGYKTRQGLPQVSTFQTFNAATVAAIGVNLSIEKAEEPLNTVKLTWNLPAIFMTQQGKFDIYRDGLKIRTAEFNDVFDMNTNNCTFVDELVTNGNHQYFVQPLVGFGDEFGGDIVYTPYNASNIATVEFNTELPAATDLKATDRWSEEVTMTDDYGNTGTMTATYLKLEWTNPADAEKYGFISNSLMSDNFQISDIVYNTLETDTAKFSTFNPTHTFYVLTRYNIGKAFSDKITVNVADVPDLSGIEAVTEDGLTVAINGKVVEVSEAANITVFSISGAKAAEAAAATSLSLSDAAAGAYIICVEKNGKISTFKAVLK